MTNTNNTNFDISLQKKELREILNKAVKDEKEKNLASPQRYFEIARLATNNLIKSKIWQESSFIFSFNAMKSEMGSDLINKEVLLQKKKLFLPKVISETEMIFTQVFSVDYQSKKGAFGIKEPIEINKNLPKVSEKVLFLLPGIAFSKKGERLGKGKGYYDKFLEKWLKKYSKTNCVFVGWCYDFQILESIPCEPTDIKVDYICTERGLTPQIN